MVRKLWHEMNRASCYGNPRCDACAPIRNDIVQNRKVAADEDGHYSFAVAL
jgi:hypothetical protein